MTFKNQPSRDYNDEYKKVRSEALKRDKYKCQMPGCKYRGKKFEVHHIKKYSTTPGSRYSLSNLITLCKKCHHSIKNKEEMYASIFTGILIRKLKND